MDTNAGHEISRRSFLKLAGATALGGCACAMGVTGCAGDGRTPAAPADSYERVGDELHVRLPAVDALAAEGGAVRLTCDEGQDDELRLILVHAAGEAFLAFADHCTHSGRPLDVAHEQGEIRCRSRKSRFGLDGALIDGPAAGPLRAYPVRCEGDCLIVQL